MTGLSSTFGLTLALIGRAGRVIFFTTQNLDKYSCISREGCLNYFLNQLLLLETAVLYLVALLLKIARPSLSAFAYNTVSSAF